MGSTIKIKVNHCRSNKNNTIKFLSLDIAKNGLLIEPIKSIQSIEERKNSYFRK